MTEDQKSKMIEKIMKLMAVGNDDRNASEHEMLEAAAMAKKLMDKYGIELATVELAQNKHLTADDMDHQQINVFDVTGKGIRRRDKFAIQLSRIIANNFGCQSAFYTGFNAVHFYGRKEKLPVAIYLYKYVLRSATEYIQREYMRQYQEARRSHGDTSIMKGWKQSFKVGFISALRHRLRLEAEKKEKTVVKPATEDTEAVTYALVVQDERSAVRDYMENNFEWYKGYVGNNNLRNTNMQGALAGQAYAKDIPLHDAIEEPKEKRLS